MLLNLYLWKFQPGISWLWWNVFGFLATFIAGYLISLLIRKPDDIDHELIWSVTRYRQFGFKINWLPRYGILIAWFVGLLLFLSWVFG